MAAVEARSVSWVLYGRRGGVAGPLGPVWLPWKSGWSAGPRMAAVGAWLVPWAPYVRRGGVAGPLGPVWPPWGRAVPLSPVLPPWGRGHSPKPSMAVVGACPVPWVLYGRRWGVAGFPGPRRAAVVAWPVF